VLPRQLHLGGLILREGGERGRERKWRKEGRGEEGRKRKGVWPAVLSSDNTIQYNIKLVTRHM